MPKKLNIPFHDRNIIDKALEELNLSSAEAKDVDENRRVYYKACTEKVWGAPGNYDIVLNVSRLGIEKVVEIIAGLYEG